MDRATNQDKVRLSVSSLIAQDLLLAEGGIVFRPEGRTGFRRLEVICASVSEASVDEARDLTRLEAMSIVR